MAEFKTPVKQKIIPSAETPFAIPPSPFLTQLGYGTGVSVYQLVRSPKLGKIRSPWAIKRVAQKNKKTTMFGKRLKEEASVLRTLNHPNIVGFRGFTKMGDGRQCLVMESCEGSLGDKIEERRDEGLGPYSPDRILKVGLDISKALDYLHTQVKLLHGDMKSFNILINGDFNICKLCDFGVSLPLDENGILDSTKCKEGYVGTACWSAPEIIEQSAPVSSKSDIFSYGLTLWEMLSLEPPHVGNVSDEIEDDSVITVEDSFEEDPSCLYGTRPAVPDINEDVYNNVLTIFYCTTEHEPTSRPSAKHIMQCIENMNKKMKRIEN